MANVCSYCSRIFSTPYSRQRHEALLHKKDDPDEESDAESTDEVVTDEEDVEFDNWSILFRQTYGKMEFEPGEKVADLLKDRKVLKDIANQLREEVYGIIEMAEYLTEESSFFQKLATTIKKLMKEEEYDDDEARIVAWRNRKEAIYKMIQDHEKQLKEAVGEE